MKFVFIVEEMKVICLKSKGFGAAHMQRISTMHTWYDLVYYIIKLYALFCIYLILYIHGIRMHYLYTVSHVFKNLIQHQNWIIVFCFLI